MVTNLKEGTKSKCEQYWPNSTGENDHFGPFTVRLTNEQVYPDFVIRQLNVKVSQWGNANYMNLAHFGRYTMDPMIVIH